MYIHRVEMAHFILESLENIIAENVLLEAPSVLGIFTTLFQKNTLKIRTLSDSIVNCNRQ